MDRCYLIFPDEIAYKDLREVSRQYVKEIQDVNPNLRLKDIFQKHYHNRCSDVEKNAMVFKYQYFIRDYTNKTYLRDALRHNVDEDIKIASHGGNASIRALCDDTALKIRQYR
jgi:hypothetical protein